MQVTINRVQPVPLETVETQRQITEQRLLNRLSRGDRAAFWQLWEQHRPYLRDRCLQWMNGDRTEAEEALSQATLKAWDKLPAYTSKITNLRSWLTRLTYNLCVDIHRKRHRGSGRMESLENLALAAENTECNDCRAVASTGSSPESAVLQDELRMYVRRAIAQLPPRLRDAFILHYYRELSHREIAKRLDISRNNADKRLQQAREILRIQLQGYLSGCDGDLDSSQSNCIDKSPIWEAPDVSKAATSPEKALAVTTAVQSINYQVTASCLETLPPVWYNSPSLLGWR